MATRKIHDLAVVVGSYTDSTGATKHRYQNIGVMMEKDDGGRFIIMERFFNPAGVMYDPERGNSIMVSMFDPKPRGERQGGDFVPTGIGPKPESVAVGADDFSDDIPFN